jgi:hypothetical protein
VTCEFSMDNSVISATYGDVKLPITNDENLGEWSERKTVSFYVKKSAEVGHP